MSPQLVSALSCPLFRTFPCPVMLGNFQDMMNALSNTNVKVGTAAAIIWIRNL